MPRSCTAGHAEPSGTGVDMPAETIPAFTSTNAYDSFLDAVQHLGLRETAP